MLIYAVILKEKRLKDLVRKCWIRSRSHLGTVLRPDKVTSPIEGAIEILRSCLAQDDSGRYSTCITPFINRQCPGKVHTYG